MTKSDITKAFEPIRKNKLRFVYKVFQNNSRGRLGIKDVPDYYIVDKLNNRAFWIESKVGADKLSEGQINFLESHNNIENVFTFVITDKNYLDIITGILDTPSNFLSLVLETREIINKAKGIK